MGLSTARAQNTVYFDVNDTAPESGVVDGTAYDWNSTGAGIAPAFWNMNSGGVGAVSPLPSWVNGDTAVFSAGTDATGALYGVKIDAGVTAAGAEIQEGIVQVVSGLFDTGTGQLLVDPGAAVRSVASGQFNNGGKITLKGTSTSDAGEFQCRNGGNAGSMITFGSGLKELEIDGFGRVSYDDGNGTPDDQVNIISSNYITGAGGTPTNGGAGTLVKSGPDQVGFQVKDTGGGVMNFELNSFAKLRVEEGGFRLRGTGGVIDDRMFGAVPLATLADAITLDGGGIGSNTTVTLDAKRGITIGPNGGYFDNGATAGMNIPGPLSGSGALTIGDPTSTSALNVTFTLSNANNVNTFSGDLIGLRATLQLNSSLKVNALQDGSTATQPTNQSFLNIGTGNTLTAGVAGGSGTWSRPITGAGGFTKAGAGTETLSGLNTYSGDTKVEGGTLSITNAYLADAADVYLTSGSIFDLAFGTTDTIRSLYIDNVLQDAGTWGASGAMHNSGLFSGSGLLDVTVGPSVGVLGDFNNDGKVDAADYVSWRKNNGTNNALPNDNGLGVPITTAHYNLWRTNFGNPPGAGSGSGLGSATAVPEPMTLGLVLVGLAALGLRRRQRIA